MQFEWGSACLKTIPPMGMGTLAGPAAPHNKFMPQPAKRDGPTSPLSYLTKGCDIMTPQNFTQKSLEAVQTAQSIATTYGSQQVEQCHLLLALLEAENGLVPQLITGMGLTLPSFHAAARDRKSVV